MDLDTKVKIAVGATTGALLVFRTLGVDVGALDVIGGWGHVM